MAILTDLFSKNGVPYVFANLGYMMQPRPATLIQAQQTMLGVQARGVYMGGVLDYFCTVDQGLVGPSEKRYQTIEGANRFKFREEMGLGELDDAPIVDPVEYDESSIYAKPADEQRLISETMAEDAVMDNNPIAQNCLYDLGMGIRMTEDYIFRALFEFGAGAFPAWFGHKGGDGLPLWSASHWINKAHTAGETFSNLRPAAALTGPNLASAHSALKEIVGPKGSTWEPSGMYLLVVARGWEQKAAELTATVKGKPEVFENTFNFFGPEGIGTKVLVLNKLDGYGWGLMDLVRMKSFLQVKAVDRGQIRRHYDGRNGATWLIGRCRLGISWIHPGFGVWSEGAAP